MKAVVVSEFEFKVIMNQAWEAEDTAIVVDFYKNRISVCYNGKNCNYLFKEEQIMKMSQVALIGIDKCAEQFIVVQIAPGLSLLGKRKGVDKALKEFGFRKEQVVPIMQTPYGAYLQ